MNQFYANKSKRARTQRAHTIPILRGKFLRPSVKRPCFLLQTPSIYSKPSLFSAEFGRFVMP